MMVILWQTEAFTVWASRVQLSSWPRATAPPAFRWLRPFGSQEALCWVKGIQSNCWAEGGTLHPLSQAGCLPGRMATPPGPSLGSAALFVFLGGCLLEPWQRPPGRSFPERQWPPAVL